MQKLEFGDVVYANVWCDDGSGAKKRPCLVLQAIGGNQYEVALISSQQARIGGKLAHEVIILDNREKKDMGLWKDSRISMKTRDLRVVKTMEIKEAIGSAPNTVLTRCAVAWKNAQ
jgi:hypothetical protein